MHRHDSPWAAGEAGLGYVRRSYAPAEEVECRPHLPRLVALRLPCVLAKRMGRMDHASQHKDWMLGRGRVAGHAPGCGCCDSAGAAQPDTLDLDRGLARSRERGPAVRALGRTCCEWGQPEQRVSEAGPSVGCEHGRGMTSGHLVILLDCPCQLAAPRTA